MAIEALPNAVSAPGRAGEIAGEAGGRGGAQGEAFAQLLAQPAAGGQPTAALDAVARTSPLQAGGQAGLGEDILGSLRRFGQTVGRMEEMGAFKPRAAQAAASQAAASQAATSLAGHGSAPGAAQPPALLPGPAEQHPRAGRSVRAGEDHIEAAMAMAQDALGHQAQLYGVMMNFTLVHSSAESLNKSLKTLLTQGGG